MGDPVHAPLALSQEAVDRGKMPGLMEPHGNNDLADGVFPHCQHPADHKCDEDPITRNAEACPETDLVNGKRIWYSLLHPGVPPPQFLINFQNWVCAERLISFKDFSPPRYRTIQKRRNYSRQRNQHSRSEEVESEGTTSRRAEGVGGALGRG
jgi:hypothetical protein